MASAASTTCAEVDGPGAEEQRLRLEPADVVEVVGQPGDALGLVADAGAHAPDPLGGQLVGVATRGWRPGRGSVVSGLAQVVGDEREELVLVGLEVGGGGDVPDDALEADHLAVAAAGLRAHVEHPAHAVGPDHDQLEPAGRTWAARRAGLDRVAGSAGTSTSPR